MHPETSLSLWRWNVTCFLFHISFFVLTLTVGRYDLSVDLYSPELTFLPGNTTLGLAPRLEPSYGPPTGRLYLTRLTALTFLQSAVAHFVNAFTPVRTALYEPDLDAHRSTVRWIEYFYSAPTVFVIVAYVSGVRDVVLLFSAAALVNGPRRIDPSKSGVGRGTAVQASNASYGVVSAAMCVDRRALRVRSKRNTVRSGRAAHFRQLSRCRGGLALSQLWVCSIVVVASSTRRFCYDVREGLSRAQRGFKGFAGNQRALSVEF